MRLQDQDLTAFQVYTNLDVTGPARELKALQNFTDVRHDSELSRSLKEILMLPYVEQDQRPMDQTTGKKRINEEMLNWVER